MTFGRQELQQSRYFPHRPCTPFVANPDSWYQSHCNFCLFWHFPPNLRPHHCNLVWYLCLIFTRLSPFLANIWKSPLWSDRSHPTATWKIRQGKDWELLQILRRAMSKGRSAAPSRQKCRWTPRRGRTRSSLICKLSVFCLLRSSTSCSGKACDSLSSGKSHPSLQQWGCCRVAHISCSDLTNDLRNFNYGTATACFNK